MTAPLRGRVEAALCSASGDVACVAWQVVVVVACLRLLGSVAARPPARLPAWHRWDDRIVLFTVGSAAVLAGLSFSGFSG